VGIWNVVRWATWPGSGGCLRQRVTYTSKTKLFLSGSLETDYWDEAAIVSIVC